MSVSSDRDSIIILIMQYCGIKYWCVIVFASNGRRNHESEHAQRMKKISALTNQLEKLELESTSLNQEIKEKQQALYKGREEYDKLR